VHELAITQSVVDAVVERVAPARVTAVHLTIGRVSGVDVEAVRFCFDLVAAGTVVEGARLDVAEPAGRAHCRRCGADFAVDDLVLLCPCGSVDVELREGGELLVRAVEVV
jgi:hydrogenase nickel incorporation protein HypA/HybF